MPRPLLSRTESTQTGRLSLSTAAPAKTESKTDAMQMARLLKKQRSKAYIEMIHKLDAGGHTMNAARCEALLAAIRAEFPDVLDLAGSSSASSRNAISAIRTRCTPSPSQGASSSTTSAESRSPKGWSAPAPSPRAAAMNSSRSTPTSAAPSAATAPSPSYSKESFPYENAPFLCVRSGAFFVCLTVECVLHALAHCRRSKGGESHAGAGGVLRKSLASRGLR